MLQCTTTFLLASGSQEQNFALILLVLVFMVVGAAAGRWLAGKVNQSPVLGELILGILVGNIGYTIGAPIFGVIMELTDAQALITEVWSTGSSVSEAAKHVFSPEQLQPGGIGTELVGAFQGEHGPSYVMIVTALWIFSNLGVMLLLFVVGLESTVQEMLRVGPRALAVAVIGIAVPFALGYFSSIWLTPGGSFAAHLFLGATLTATSVGITARVFRDLGFLQTRSAKIILGAAVIDDVLGLVILAVVVGIVATGTFDVLAALRILGLSLLFIGIVIVLGDWIVRKLLFMYRSFDKHHDLLLFPLALAFLMAWLANALGLAAIVGAFAAGLLIRDDLFGPPERGHSVEHGIAPLERFFAPIFFVLIGMQVNLHAFADPKTALLGGAFTVAAIIGKIVSGAAAGPGTDRLSVGIGMVPRGEVGLIFASVGKGLGVVSEGVFAAVVLMVIVTTLVTPVALRWSLNRAKSAEGAK